jgi:di/tripeptidase
MNRHHSSISIAVLLLVALCFAQTTDAKRGSRQDFNREKSTLLTIKVNGTRGGHSGDDIGRTGSALSLLIDLLFPINDLRLVSISTTNSKGNAIPTDGEALVVVPNSEVENIKRAAARMSPVISLNPFYVNGPAPERKAETASIITVAEAVPQTDIVPLDLTATRRVLAFLARLPVGPQVVDELGVNLSSNLAWVKIVPNTSKFTALLTTRYNDERLLEAHRSKIDFLSFQLGAKVSHEFLYPPWVAAPNLEKNELATIAKEAYRVVTGGEVLKFKRVHGGLELPIVIRNCRPSVQSISLGVDIIDAHSENERLNLDSVKITYGVVAEILRTLTGAPVTDSKPYYADRANSATALFIEKICPIPRPSDNPRYIVSFLKQYARDHSLIFEEDEAHNVLIRSRGSCDATKPLVVLHAHHDMVVAGPNEKEVLTRGVKPIRFQEHGVPFLKADKSSLGADNGMGMAIGLTLLSDPKLCHGELAFLITAAEEAGLVGAKNLGRSIRDLLQNAYAVISLDGFSSNGGEIGSAGYVNHLIEIPLQPAKTGKPINTKFALRRKSGDVFSPSRMKHLQ